jgi:RHS repeat-associated protein
LVRKDGDWQQEFTIAYNSLDTTVGPLGRGWTHNYNISITIRPLRKSPLYEEALLLTKEDGARVYFYNDGVNTNIFYSESSSGEHSIIIKNNDITYTLTEKTGIKYDFDSNGKLISITDRNGNTLTLTYTEDNLTKITDSSGREITFTYDENNRIISITDPAGRTTTFTYNGDYLSTVTDPLGATWTYTYDANGRMLTKTDPMGHTTTYTYDEKGRIISSIDPEGNIKTITYDQTNQIAIVTEKNGSQWIYVYDNILNVPLQIIDPSGNQTIYQYDSNRNLISKTEPGGITTTYTYDANGNMLSKTDALGNTTTYTYNEFGQVLTITDPDGNTTTYTYDANGNLLEVIDAQGNKTIHTYGSHGERLSTTDPNGNTTTYTYDQYGNLASVTNALGQTVTYTYDIMGNLLSITDANGNTTTYEYDLKDRLIKETRPDGGIITYEYDLAGNRTAIIDANGNKTTFTYDSLNRLIKTTDPEGNTINYTYDPEGNMTSMTIKDSSGNVMTSTTYTYDIYSRLIKTTHADGTYIEQTYDVRGNILTKKDENGNITTFTYDALNRLVSVTDPNGGVISYNYDSRGNLTSVTDANGNITTYTYDSLNRLISITSPDTGTTTYTYDANGNLILKTDANGVTITYIYDVLNRLTAVQFPDSTQNITYTYDDPQYQNSIGRLTSMTDPSGTTWYDYDKMGRVIKETKQINNLYYRTQYSYDLNGNLTEITYPGRRIITYIYNSLNKVTSVKETFYGVTKTLVDNITYLPFGDMTSMTQGNGIITTKSYNNRYQLTNLTIGTLKDLSYTRDNVGNITAIIDNLDPAKSKTYTYDNLYRLTQATGPWGTISYSYDPVGNRTNETTDMGSTNYNYTANKLTSTTGEKTFNFSYDNNGNTITENTKQYIYNQNQRLIKAMENSTVLGEYVYNGNGQRVKKTVNGQTTIFHYDQNGLLIAESTETGTITNEYIYLNDKPLAKIANKVSGIGLNQPVPRFNASLSVSVDASSLSTGRLKYYYTLLRLSFVSTSITGLSIIGNTATIIGEGMVNRKSGYTFRVTIVDGNPDEMGIEIYDSGGELYYQDLPGGGTQALIRGNFTIGNSIYYYHNDHLGTPMFMTDENQNIVWEGEFLPFGEAYSVTGSITNNFRFPGQYYDEETGLHYNYFRDYKPEIGRYVEADPILQPMINLETTNSGCVKTTLSWRIPGFISKPQNLQPYVYVKNNSVNYIDPLGLLLGGENAAFRQEEKCERKEKCPPGQKEVFHWSAFVGCLTAHEVLEAEAIACAACFASPIPWVKVTGCVVCVSIGTVVVLDCKQRATWCEERRIFKYQ